jgi:hypothetical protein
VASATGVFLRGAAMRIPPFFGVGADLVSARFLCHGTVEHKALPYKAFSKIFNKNFILHWGGFGL